jgi:hypothetical protein
LIAVMKAADLRNRNDATGCWRLNFSLIGAIVAEGLMRARGIVVRDIPAQQASEVPFVDHEDVIEAFPTNRPDDALGEGILPGCPRGDEDLAHPQAFQPPHEHVAVDGIPIAEQVRVRGLIREALDQLVGSPGGGWVVGNVDMDEFSTMVSKNQEPEEQAEGERGDNEEVDGDNVTDMRLQEGAPRRGWPRRGAPHVLGNGELGDLIAEETEFGLDPTPAPGRVRSGHVADQRAKLKIERRATTGRRRDFQRQ